MIQTLPDIYTNGLRLIGLNVESVKGVKGYISKVAFDKAKIPRLWIEIQWEESRVSIAPLSDLHKITSDGTYHDHITD